MRNEGSQLVNPKTLLQEVSTFFETEKPTSTLEKLEASFSTFEKLKQLPFDAKQSNKSKFEPVVAILFEALGFFVQKRWWTNKDKKGDVDFVAFFQLPKKKAEAFVVEVSTSAGDSEKMQKLWSRCMEIGEKFSIIAYPAFATLRSQKDHLNLGIFSSNCYPPGGIRLLTVDILDDLFRAAIKQSVPFEKIIEYINCQMVSEWAPTGPLRYSTAYPLFMSREERDELTRFFKA